MTRSYWLSVARNTLLTIALVAAVLLVALLVFLFGVLFTSASVYRIITWIIAVQVVLCLIVGITETNRQ
jgi:uncharacterized membrane protein